MPKFWYKTILTLRCPHGHEFEADQISVGDDGDGYGAICNECADLNCYLCAYLLAIEPDAHTVEFDHTLQGARPRLTCRRPACNEATLVWQPYMRWTEWSRLREAFLEAHHSDHDYRGQFGEEISYRQEQDGPDEP